MAAVKKGSARKRAEVVAVVRCVRCKSERDIRPGEIPPDEVPMCGKCFLPMCIDRAETR